MRAPEEVGPQVLHVAGPPALLAQDAEADVRPVAGQRERPHVPREQIGLEPHVEPVGRWTRDLADVLTERVPLAQIPRLGRRRAPCGPGSTSRRRRSRSARRTVPRPSIVRSIALGGLGATVRRTCSRRGCRRLAARARSTSAASRSLPGRDGGELPCRPGAAARPRARTANGATPSDTSCQPAPVAGSSPRCSSSRSASVVSPSPQHLSRGKTALSTTTTWSTAARQVDRRRRPGRPGADHEHVARDRGGGGISGEHGTEATAGRSGRAPLRRRTQIPPTCPHHFGGRGPTPTMRPLRRTTINARENPARQEETG